MSKQTAVEWLVINYLGLHDEYNTLSLEEIVKQAKAMHKEEHRKTWIQSVMSKYKTFEHYYNETFGGQDND